MSRFQIQGLLTRTGRRACLLAASVAAISLTCAAPASANGLDLGTAGDYAVVDLGNGTTFGWNVPVTGNMLIGNGVTAGFAGGASITGRIYYDSTTQGQSTFTQVTGCNPASNCSTQVSGSVTGDALTSANNVANYAAGLAANLTFGTINSATTFAATGAQTVVDVTSIMNAAITISGTASDIFVVNVTGAFSSNISMILTGGVTASDILFNFTATGAHVLETSGGNCGGKTCLYGTFLATKGGQFQFSNLDLTGALINTDGNIQLVSGSVVNYVPFMPQVPEPASIALFGTALLGLGGISVARRRKSKS